MKRLVFLVALALVISGTANVNAAAWKPARDIEFINPNAAGGGSDLNARTIVEVAKAKNFCPTNFMINYKTGGSGAVGFSYLATKRGDPHTLYVLHSGHDLASYVLNWDVKATDLTYIATVAEDALMLCARADGPFKDLKTTVELSKKQRVTCGGASRGTYDHLCMILANNETGAKFEYVNFASSGENVAAMLGGHVDLGVLNPSECIGQVRAGKIIPLATYSPTREPGEFANVPTFVELGYPNLVNIDTRNIVGPPDMPAEAVDFYAGMLKKITETEEWKENYIKRNFLRPIFLGPKESREKLTSTSAVALERFKAEQTEAKDGKQ